VTAVTSEPTHSYSLPDFPLGDVIAHFVNDAGDLMSRNPWILDIWEYYLLGNRITVANTTGLNLDAHFSVPWFRNLSFYYFE